VTLTFDLLISKSNQLISFVAQRVCVCVFAIVSRLQCNVQFVQTSARITVVSQTVALMCAVVIMNVSEVVLVPPIVIASFVVTLSTKDAVCTHVREACTRSAVQCRTHCCHIVKVKLQPQSETVHNAVVNVSVDLPVAIELHQL